MRSLLFDGNFLGKNFLWNYFEGQKNVQVEKFWGQKNVEKNIIFVEIIWGQKVSQGLKIVSTIILIDQTTTG